MSITLIDKIKQANDADFKLLDASDLNFDSAAKTIASDAITQDASAIWNIVDTEASAASDNLSTITRSSKGPNSIIVSPANDARTIVIKHNVGNIKCVNNADITLDDLHDWVWLIYDGSTNWYAQALGGGTTSVPTENFENKAGSDCTGTDGATNRMLTLTNASLSSNEVVVHDRSTLHPTQDYTPNHLSASSTITFLNNVWNDQKIRVRYLT